MDNRIITNNLTIEHLYTVENYYTFKMTVSSGDYFSGTSNFCLSKEQLSMIINEVSNMYKTLKGRCEFADYDSDSYILLEMESLGHMSISGRIGGSHGDHSLKFKFITDQTALGRIIDSFRNVV